MKPFLTENRRLNLVFFVFLIVAFLVGIAGALQLPTLSRFLSDEVKVTSFWVGIFYSVNASIAVLVSFILALYSDRKGDRKKIIMVCCVLAIANTVLFAYSRNYIILITLGVLLAAFMSCISPQLFALAREYTDRSARDAMMFSAIMRAQISLAWVIGPPLAFMISINYGFTVMFLCAAGAFLIAAVAIWFFLPTITRYEIVTHQITPVSSTLKDKDIVLLFLSSTLMWCCNMMYLIDMPLYTVQLFANNFELAGYLMGTAAGLEIPIMLLAGFYAKRFGKWRMMILAVISGSCFYLGLSLFETKLAWIVLQVFNAIFIGIIASVGMLYFQDLMPGKPGEATTLFTNSVAMGTILAGILQGNIAQYFGHFYVYVLALILSIIALILYWTVRKV